LKVASLQSELVIKKVGDDLDAFFNDHNHQTLASPVCRHLLKLPLHQLKLGVRNLNVAIRTGNLRWAFRDFLS
jgi:hypothetical protein